MCARQTYGPVWTKVKNIPDTEEHNVNTKHCIPYRVKIKVLINAITHYLQTSSNKNKLKRKRKFKNQPKEQR